MLEVLTDARAEGGKRGYLVAELAGFNTQLLFLLVLLSLGYLLTTIFYLSIYLYLCAVGHGDADGFRKLHGTCRLIEKMSTCEFR
jgi:hypothetical protein